MTGGGFRGRSVSTAVYLDAESAGTVIRDVAFDIRTGREHIAIDGSARNRIEAQSLPAWRAAAVSSCTATAARTA